jgi:hypothetical protein
MSKPATKRRLTKVANILASFGYLSIVVQWFWAIATVAIPYIQHSSLELLFVPTTSAPANTPMQHVDLPIGIQITMMIAAIIFVLAITLYAIYAIPRTVGKLGRNVTKKGAAVTIKHIKHHHQPLTPIEKKRVYEYITWGIKFLLMIAPCALLLLPTHQSLTISHAVVLIIGIFCLGLSLVWFGLQYLIALICRIPAKDIW